MKKQQYANIKEGFFNFVTDYINQPKVTPEPVVTIPKGVIVIWSGLANNIPNGWALCDGTNGTPDLTGRFVIGGIAGGGFNSIGNKGGRTEITLSPYNLPLHTHSGSVTISGTTSTNGNHNHTYGTGQGWGPGDTIPQHESDNNERRNSGRTDDSGNHSHTFSATGTYKTNGGDLTSNSQAINILNPYYALAYIMKL